MIELLRLIGNGKSALDLDTTDGVNGRLVAQTVNALVSVLDMSNVDLQGDQLVADHLATILERSILRDCEDLTPERESINAELIAVLTRGLMGDIFSAWEVQSHRFNDGGEYSSVNASLTFNDVAGGNVVSIGFDIPQKKYDADSEVMVTTSVRMSAPSNSAFPNADLRLVYHRETCLNFEINLLVSHLQAISNLGMHYESGVWRLNRLSAFNTTAAIVQLMQEHEGIDMLSAFDIGLLYDVASNDVTVFDFGPFMEVEEMIDVMPTLLAYFTDNVQELGEVHGFGYRIALSLVYNVLRLGDGCEISRMSEELFCILVYDFGPYDLKVSIDDAVGIMTRCVNDISHMHEDDGLDDVSGAIEVFNESLASAVSQHAELEAMSKNVAL
ncbi:hypothetical protein AB6E89_17370 [Vibrio breoganii]